MPTTTMPFVIAGIVFLSNNALQVIVKGLLSRDSDFRDLKRSLTDLKQWERYLITLLKETLMEIMAT